MRDSEAFGHDEFFLCMLSADPLLMADSDGHLMRLQGQQSQLNLVEIYVDSVTERKTRRILNGLSFAKGTLSEEALAIGYIMRLLEIISLTEAKTQSALHLGPGSAFRRPLTLH